MFRVILLFCLMSLHYLASGQTDQNEVFLIIRGDDMGSTNSSNDACIKSYKEGIMTSVEVMVPCAWFTQAARLCNENPGLDVGIHLVLTSEWDDIRWRPLTCAPSLVDDEGYFHHFIWPNKNYPSSAALLEKNWSITEVERELRAQIELGVKLIPQTSHISAHMGCDYMDPRVETIFKKLANEFNLTYVTNDYNVKNMDGFSQIPSYEMKLKKFMKIIDNLQPGVHMFIDHPGLNSRELTSLGHKGYNTVGQEREDVTKVFTDPGVKDRVRSKKIKLIGYKDLKKPVKKQP